MEEDLFNDKDQEVAQEEEIDKDVQDQERWIEKDNATAPDLLPKKEIEIGKDKDPVQEVKVENAKKSKVMLLTINMTKKTKVLLSLILMTQ